ncbi:hypothetical protein [Methanothermococcus okinawensis]|uniref:Glutamate synthase alpha subunit domain protein n=1 Tax=Methanothermococcus okinawensis (strain DSM 14208 / JCM 11175 / IH1) TaxID=647113 RepID=F8AMV1_METOI|nr:hypothetical protein [Methanothermococcus okinawensis]AEH06074.1 glutamate synthase alpha subunit domain protein [Methanothermococcus okinawensis IH1]
MVFGLFSKKKSTINDFLDKNKERILNIHLNEPIDCICDFTYNFIWQSSFDYNQKVVDGVSFKDLVEHLKNGGIVYIKGNVGHRFCSSMGADLKYFGGTGSKIDTGTVIVDGDIDTRFGISMVSGTVYVNEHNNIKEPVGNIIEVESDIKGYKKYISITQYVEGRYKDEKLLKPNKFDKNNHNLILNDKIIRDTIGARLEKDVTITINGNVDLSTGILMKKGKVVVNGNAGKNTGAVLNGGTVIIYGGDTGDFTGFEMKNGIIIVNGNAGKFLGAKKKGGVIYAKEGSPVSPTKKYPLDKKDNELLNKYGLFGGFYKFQ